MLKSYYLGHEPMQKIKQKQKFLAETALDRKFNVEDM